MILYDVYNMFYIIYIYIYILLLLLLLLLLLCIRARTRVRARNIICTYAYDLGVLMHTVYSTRSMHMHK